MSCSDGAGFDTCASDYQHDPLNKATVTLASTLTLDMNDMNKPATLILNVELNLELTSRAID